MCRNDNLHTQVCLHPLPFNRCSHYNLSMIEVLSCRANGHALVTLAVGESYLEKWKNHASESWIAYCKAHGLGLYVQEENQELSGPSKKVTWQKLLIPQKLREQFSTVKTFCYLDSDIVINPQGENVFDYINNLTLNLVSQVKGLPFNLKYAQKIISFYRHNYYSKDYPLDSAIFMTPEQIFSWHGFESFDNYACLGFFAGSIDQLATDLYGMYHSYSHDVVSLTDGGDEPILNFEFQSKYRINWLPYRFQAIWLFELATKYPFLYNPSHVNPRLIKECVNSSILNNCFLHFAGSWGESSHIQIGPFLNTEESSALLDYLKRPVSATPKGRILPKKLAT